MHPIFNPKNLLHKTVEISYFKNKCGELAKISPIDIGDGQYKIVFEQAPEDEEQDDPFIWTTQEPESVEGNTAFFRNIGVTNFYLKVKQIEQHENNSERIE